MSETLAVDVVAVDIEAGKVLWVYATDERNAEAVMGMAVMRQGVEDRFYTEAPRGKFKIGDKYEAEP